MINVYEEIVRMQRDCQAGVLVSVVDKKGHGPAAVGSKLLVRASGELIGTVGGGELEYLAVEKSRELLITRNNLLQSCNLSGESKNDTVLELAMMCGGSITLFYEYIPACPRAYIFGAGHIGRSLVHHLSALDFRTVVIDNRADLKGNIPESDLMIGEWIDLIAGEPNIQGNYVVICSPSHETDYLILKTICEAGWTPFYLGLVASPAKSRTMVYRLSEELGRSPDLSFLRSPAGLALGGKTPGEIAISIIAEMQSVRCRKENTCRLSPIW